MKISTLIVTQSFVKITTETRNIFCTIIHSIFSLSFFAFRSVHYSSTFKK